MRHSKKNPRTTSFDPSRAGCQRQAGLFCVALLTLIFISHLPANSAFGQQLTSATEKTNVSEAAKIAERNRLLGPWIERQQKVRQVIKKVGPAVVSINDGESWGSGVVVSKDGLVLTAGHVILSEDAEYTIFFPNGRQVAAKALGKNLNLDAGMMKITEKGEYPYVDIASGKHKRRGAWCIALGHAGGFDIGRRPPVRLGKILRPEYDAYITDCAIIGGDSGGPLFDLNGSLIGIHSSIGDTIAQNRHVRIAKFLKHWDRLLAGESWGKLPGTEDDEEEALPKPRPRNSAALGVEVDRSDRQAVVRKVSPGSAAEKFGIQKGDIILEIQGTRIFSPGGLVKEISKKRAGDSVKITLQRGKSTIIMDVTLGRM